MPDNIQKYIGNIGTFGRSRLNRPTNAPFADRQTRYFDTETAANVREMAKYSTDYYRASVQGIDYDNFYDFTEVYIRLADAISATALTNIVEDFKQILIADSDYIGIGAKVVTAGNTYLVISPSNTSSVSATALVRRCNTVFHYLDYYGNVQAEPMCWGSSKGALATAPENQELMVLMSSYQHSVIQNNPNTVSRIRENARIVLGDQIYRVRGVVNFTQEFTEDADSTHITHFDLEVVEPSEYDDMENKVAGGLSFSWVISIDGDGIMSPNAEQQLTATSLRENEAPNEVLYPVSYRWTTSDSNVATVSNSGAVSAVGMGECEIICTLEQNPNISAKFSLSVVEQGNYIAWTPPATITQYTTATFAAAYYENGIKTDNPITYIFSGDTDSYTATVDGNRVSITCFYPSTMTVTAAFGTESETAEIVLEAI